jgi:hypothetical protein
VGKDIQILPLPELPELTSENYWKEKKTKFSEPAQ